MNISRLKKLLALSLITSAFLSGCGDLTVNSNVDTETNPSTKKDSKTTDISDSQSMPSPSSSSETSSGSLPAGKMGYTMDVDGVNITVASVLPLDGFDRQVASYLTLGDTPTLQLRMIPEKASSADYDCGDGPDFRKIAMSYNSFISDGDKAGNCHIKVTSVGDIYEGTFSGTLYNTSGKEMVITNGFFRNDGSQLK